jgi:hypothetical protein
MSTLAQAMPTILRHAGVWEGVYRHVDAQGQWLDQHNTRIRCEFPSAGPYAYIQHNHFWWPDGRESFATLPGIFRDGRLWWDVPTFHGYAWETDDGVILLNLTRKDLPNASFLEIIVLAPDGLTRGRTWHWFQDNQLIKRTLCDERKVS